MRNVAGDYLQHTQTVRSKNDTASFLAILMISEIDIQGPRNGLAPNTEQALI